MFIGERDINTRLKRFIEAYLKVQDQIGWKIPLPGDWQNSRYLGLSGVSKSKDKTGFDINFDSDSLIYVLYVNNRMIQANTKDDLIHKLNRLFPNA